ncbi:MAG TPA: rhomboid family intramembrane serine protease [Gemmatimonadales bacterium]|jgi:membrane associated rhomboid family serine protease|nr:rhomboid family intramembrane serine protease [Gemmatimonadales bacterium]
MFPIKDENPTILTPVVTLGIIVVNVVVWLLVQQMGTEPGLSQSVCQLGLIPGEFLHRLPEGTQVPMGPDVTCELSGGATWYTPLTSMFMHGGWLHLIGNMWFLWVFGNNIEDSMGHFRFLIFYLLCGLLAAGTQVAVQPSSAIPMVGASGAISAVMGAYIVLYPRVKVHMLIFLGIFVTTVQVPAVWMLGYWFLLQIVGGIPALASESGGVAFWAHAGGFIAGAILIFLFKDRELLAQRQRALSYG